MSICLICEKYISLLKSIHRKDNFAIEEWDPIYDLEREILTRFGLPNSFQLSSFAQAAALNSGDLKDTSNRFMRLLTDCASDYLMAPILSNKELMEMGKRCKVPFDDVLPNMGIDTHSYCVFVYKELYCPGKITIEEAIEALQKSMDDSDNLLSEFMRFTGEYNLQINLQIYAKLQQLQIPFVEAYLQHEIDVRSKNTADDKDWHKLFERGKSLPVFISLTHFFIIKIECYEYGDGCFLNIIFESNEGQWCGIILYCTRNSFDMVLSHSRFHTHSSLIRANLSENVLMLNLKKDFAMRNLEIIELPLQLKMIIEEDTGSKTLGYYTMDDPLGNILQQDENIIDPELPF